MEVELFVGDITEAPADVVCTSTNPRLSLMMGTGGAVRERGGFGILRECERIVDAHGGSVAPGSAYITSAGVLPFRAVIHCVANSASHRSSPEIVRACVRDALVHADAIGCDTIAMPLFGTGHAHLDVGAAVRAILEGLRGANSLVQRVLLVVPDRETAGRVTAVTPLGERESRAAVAENRS